MNGASVGKVLCLLNNFKTDDVIDYPSLKIAIASNTSGDSSQDAEVLMSIVQQCEDNENAEHFAQCWAEIVVLDCVYQEAKVPGEVCSVRPVSRKQDCKSIVLI